MVEMGNPEDPADQGMDDDELVAVCNSELERSIYGIGDNFDVSRAVDYYLGKLPGITRIEGKDPMASRIVSLDLMDAVEATTAEIMQMYDGEEIAFFAPLDIGDEQQARTETDIVNYLFLEEHHGYRVLQTAVKDALINRNGVVKVFWDRRMGVEYAEYKGVTDDQIAPILVSQGPEESIEVVERIEAEEIPTSAELEAASQVASDDQPLTDGIIPQAEASREAAYDYLLRRTRVVEEPMIVNVPPEEVRVSSEHTLSDLQDSRFCAHTKLETASSLIAQGYDRELVESLPAYSQNYSDQVTLSRARTVTETLQQSDHDSTRPIEVSECYIQIDYDGDGIAERRMVVVSGSVLLSNTPIAYTPLISGVGTVMPHKYQGVSLMDRLEDIQDGKTSLLRSIIDGAKLAATTRVGVVGTNQVNIEDLLLARTGGVVRMLNRDAVVPLPNPEVPGSVFQTMGFLDQARRERGGSAVDTASQAQQIAGDTAHGIERTMSAMELHNSMVAKTIGETLIRGIFLQLHRLLRMYRRTPVQAQIGGRWVESQPSEWRERNKVTIMMGSSRAERNRQAAVMFRVLDMHEKLHGMAAPLVDLQASYRAIIDALRLAGVRSPESYFVDPQTPQGQQRAQEADRMREEDKRRQDEMQAMIADAQQQLAKAEQIKAQAAAQGARYKAEIDQLRAQLDAIKNNADIALRRQKQSDDFALGVTDLELKAQRDLSNIVRGNR